MSRFFLILISAVALNHFNIFNQSQAGKILANMPFVELSDYRFGLGDPYIVFYERENFRGQVHFHRIGKKCTNLNENYMNWASSVDTQRRCVTLCEEPDCQGHCARIFPHPNLKVSRGAHRLHEYGLNDKVASVKYCY